VNGVGLQFEAVASRADYRPRERHPGRSYGIQASPDAPEIAMRAIVPGRAKGGAFPQNGSGDVHELWSRLGGARTRARRVGEGWRQHASAGGSFATLMAEGAWRGTRKKTNVRGSRAGRPNVPHGKEARRYVNRRRAIEIERAIKALKAKLRGQG